MTEPAPAVLVRGLDTIEEGNEVLSMTDGSLRVGDTDRLMAADRLAAHTTAGRLTLAEHDQRVAAVWAARTRADLNAVFTDLPAPVTPRTSGTLTPAAVVLSGLLVATVLAMWLGALVNPGWAASMMAACM